MMARNLRWHQPLKKLSSTQCLCSEFDQQDFVIKKRKTWAHMIVFPFPSSLLKLLPICHHSLKPIHFSVTTINCQFGSPLRYTPKSVKSKWKLHFIHNFFLSKLKFSDFLSERKTHSIMLPPLKCNKLSVSLGGKRSNEQLPLQARGWCVCTG